MATTERVKKVIVKEFDGLRKDGEPLKVETLDENDNLIGLGMDSVGIDKAELRLHLEDKFSRKIPEEEEEKWETVGDVVRCVEKHLKKVETS